MSRLDLARLAVRPQLKARVMLSGPAGSGKAQPIDTVIPTPAGPRKMGDLRPGDRVFGSDGRPTEILSVHPQGAKAVYRVTFDDGSSTEACAEHLWFTVNRDKTRRVLSTADLVPGKHRVPLMSGPLTYPERDLPIDPYVLGVLIGDGYLGPKQIGLSTDEWIVDLIRDDLAALGTRVLHVADTNDPAVRHYSLHRDGTSTRPWMLLDVLRALGLSGGLAANKRIPEDYLTASAEQRLALLQGLLDTDGWTNGPSTEYSTVSETLADQVTELVESLGGRCRMRRRASHYTTADGGRVATQDHWRGTVTLPPGMVPNRLPRKLERFTDRSDGRWGWRHVRTVEESRRAECACISVAAEDRLYVTEHGIVTHNTRTALIIAEVLAEGGRVLVIDTERESALTYADDFTFEHLPWQAPFDPRELTSVIAEAGRAYDVVIVDSGSHFWRASGGTLDIANGKFTGWAEARPAQEDLIEAILAADAHVIFCARAKMKHEQVVENGKHVVKKLGMGPIQDDDLEYEVNVSVSIDMGHTLAVAKSRTVALPVGREFKPGHAVELAELYRDWLKGGEPPASKAVVDGFVERMNALPEADRKAAKQEFMATLGRPDHLAESQVDDAEALVSSHEAKAKAATWAAEAGPPSPNGVDDEPVDEPEPVA